MPPGGPNNKFAFAIVSAATDEAEKLAVASNIATAAPESPCSSNPPSELEGDPFASGPPLEQPDDDSIPGNVGDTGRVDFSPSLYGRLPRLARSVSMPGSKHLGHLQPVNWGTNQPSSLSAFHELSNELADSVQAVVQTLLHISPPHLLAPVKEQFSPCAVQLPSPSVSSLFTTMKNLNYMSANLHFFASDREYSALNPDAQPDRALDNFDIGEVLQSVGDVLSGIASRSSVDLVLYHGDVGMKHINVIGDECCIMFILTHVSLPLPNSVYN
jgi:osomolarity two-component system, response regulator SSK1